MPYAQTRKGKIPSTAIDAIKKLWNTYQMKRKVESSDKLFRREKEVCVNCHGEFAHDNVGNMCERCMEVFMKGIEENEKEPTWKFITCAGCKQRFIRYSNERRCNGCKKKKVIEYGYLDHLKRQLEGKGSVSKDLIDILKDASSKT